MSNGVPRITIRPAVASDLAVLHDLAERSVAALLPQHYSLAQLAAVRSIGMYRVEDDLIADGTYYVLSVGVQIVAASGWSRRGEFHPPGTAGGHGHPVPDGTATMRATYVDPNWTRRGLATVLAGVTELAASMAGFGRFEALCTPPSEAVRERLGYRVVERMDVPIVGEVTVRAARMRKERGGP